MIRPSILLAVTLLASACSHELTLEPAANRVVGTEVEITVDQASYHAGDLIGVTLSNGTTHDYGFNLCGRAFERRDGSSWTPMPPELRLCTADLRGLPAGSTRGGQADLPAGFAPGTYRLLVQLPSMSSGGTGVTAISAPFTVE